MNADQLIPWLIGMTFAAVVIVLLYQVLKVKSKPKGRDETTLDKAGDRLRKL